MYMKNKVLSRLKYVAVLLFALVLCLGFLSLGPTKSEANADTAGQLKLTLYAKDAKTGQAITTLSTTDTSTEILIYGEVTENSLNANLHGLEFFICFNIDEANPNKPKPVEKTIFDYVEFVSSADLRDKYGKLANESTMYDMAQTFFGGWPVTSSTSTDLHNPSKGFAGLQVNNDDKTGLVGDFYAGGVKLKLNANAEVKNGDTATIHPQLFSCYNMGDASNVKVNGLNDITITFTGEDTPEPEEKAELTGAKLNNTAFTKDTEGTTFTYPNEIPYSQDSIDLSNLELTTDPADASWTLSLGDQNFNKGATGSLKLEEGKNEITVTVTNGDASNTYTLVINRTAASTDALLKVLRLSAGGTNYANPSAEDLKKEPSGGSTRAFTATDVPYAQRNNVSLYVEPSDAHSTITIFGLDDYTDTTGLGDGFSGSKTIALKNLKLGEVIDVTIQLQAEDGDSAAVYSLSFKVLAADTDNTLQTLDAKVAGNSVLSPSYTASTDKYNANVPFGTTSVDVTATAKSALAEVSIAGTKGTSKTVTGLKNADTIQVVVTPESGSGDAKTYTITIVYADDTNCDLASLDLKVGSTSYLSPNFSAGNTEYTAKVPFGTTQVNVTATAAAGDRAKVEGTGTKDLDSSGTTELIVKVTAQDPTKTKEYKITVTVQGDTNNQLESLSVALESEPSKSLITFVASQKAYTIDVPYGTNKVIVNAKAVSSTATITIGGTTNTQTIEATVNLTSDRTQILVTVKSASGASNPYTITVNRLADTDCELKNLKITLTTNATDLITGFSPSTEGYTITVPYGTTQVKVTPTAAATAKSITVNGTTVNSGAEATIQIKNNKIEIVVTAADGKATKTYTVTVEYLPDTRCELTNLTFALTPTVSGKSARLDPTLKSGTYNYRVDVPYGTTQIAVTATTVETATVKINNGTATKRTVTSSVGVNPTTITIVVTAEDGKSEHTYTVTINVLDDDDCLLKELTVKLANGDAVKLDFNPNTTSYTVNVPDETSTLKIAATRNATTSTFTINGSSASDGVAVDVTVTDNGKITIIVTAMDTKAKTTYTITVKYDKENDATLESLTVELADGSSVPLSPAFKSDGITYSISLPLDTKSVNVAAKATSSKAKVKINNGTEATQTATSTVNTGNSGSITILVTAQDGTEKTYTINYTVQQRDGNTNLSSLTVTVGGENKSLKPKFSAATRSYTVVVPKETKQATITEAEKGG